jgi:hypothetical protein
MWHHKINYDCLQPDLSVTVALNIIPRYGHKTSLVDTMESIKLILCIFDKINNISFVLLCHLTTFVHMYRLIISENGKMIIQGG